MTYFVYLILKGEFASHKRLRFEGEGRSLPTEGEVTCRWIGVEVITVHEE